MIDPQSLFSYIKIPCTNASISLYYSIKYPPCSLTISPEATKGSDPMDNSDEFEDLVKELENFETEAKTLHERIARLMHDAREISTLVDGGDGIEAETVVEGSDD
jgi:hypothetical protein